MKYSINPYIIYGEKGRTNNNLYPYIVCNIVNGISTTQFPYITYIEENVTTIKNII